MNVGEGVDPRLDVDVNERARKIDRKRERESNEKGRKRGPPRCQEELG